MTVTVRFAPSPTGFLHIGGARTALFNFLFARHHGGRYVLRIEDTDRARSTPEAVRAILDGLAWLGLEGDEAPVYQSHGLSRHQEIAHQLLKNGQAYRCYCTPEELEDMRKTALAEGRRPGYDRRWRDRDPADQPDNQPFTIRIKMPLTGESTLEDLVQGPVTIAHDQLDDFVLLRADGTPTYMLSVVVDDHDMGITHIIRGDDHLTNAHRQFHLTRAAGWEPPQFAHIPLIHGPDGAKLSKRHGALGVESYREMGYLPEALKNYLLRLGWSYGDEEIISEKDSIAWFSLERVGRAPARFDFGKLENLNGHYLRLADEGRLVDLVRQHLRDTPDSKDALDDPAVMDRLTRGMEGLKPRAATVTELADNALIYIVRPDYGKASDKTVKLLHQLAGDENIKSLCAELEALDPWNTDRIEDFLRQTAKAQNLGLGKLAQPLRAAVTGRDQSPGLFEVMSVLGKSECLARIETALTWVHHHG